MNKYILTDSIFLMVAYICVINIYIYICIIIIIYIYILIYTIYAEPPLVTKYFNNKTECTSEKPLKGWVNMSEVQFFSTEEDRDVSKESQNPYSASFCPQTTANLDVCYISCAHTVTQTTTPGWC